MITKQQLLAASDAELPRLLAIALQPGPNKHKVGQSLEEMAVSEYHCMNCGKENYSEDSSCDRTRLDLTWDNAMKYRDRAVGKWGGSNFKNAIHRMHPSDSFEYWLANGTQPRHHLIAAASLEIDSKEGE